MTLINVRRGVRSSDVWDVQSDPEPAGELQQNENMAAVYSSAHHYSVTNERIDP